MNILQMEDTIKGLSDEVLMGEAQQPTGQVPQYLVISEVQRRADMRNRYQQQQQEQPQGTVADQVIQRGIAGVAPPPPEVGQAMNGGPPQAMNGGPPQAMYGGGVVRMQDRGGVPFYSQLPDGPTMSGIQDDINAALKLGSSIEEIRDTFGPKGREYIERAGFGHLLDQTAGVPTESEWPDPTRYGQNIYESDGTPVIPGSEAWEWAKENPAQAAGAGMLMVPGGFAARGMGIAGVKLAQRYGPKVLDAVKGWSQRSRFFTKPGSGQKVVLDKAGNPHTVGPRWDRSPASARARAVQAGGGDSVAFVPRALSPTRALTTLGAGTLVGDLLLGGDGEAGPAATAAADPTTDAGITDGALVDDASRQGQAAFSVETGKPTTIDSILEDLSKLRGSKEALPVPDYTSLILASETREREAMSGMQRLAEGLAIAQLGAGIAAGDLPGGLSKAAEIAGKTKKEGFLVRRQEELIRDTYKLRIIEASSVAEKEAWTRELEVITSMATVLKTMSIAENEQIRFITKLMENGGLLRSIMADAEAALPAGSTNTDRYQWAIRRLMPMFKEPGGGSATGGASRKYLIKRKS